MRELGRALAFDPNNDRALRTLTSLLLSPPRELPPQAELAIIKAQDDAVRVASRAGGMARLSILALTPFALWMGIRDAGALAAIVGSMLFAALLAFVTAWRPRPGTLVRDLELVASVVAVMSLSSIFGPFIVLPTVATITAVAFSVAAFTIRERILIVALSCLSVIVPVLLELTGVWKASYTFEGGVMIVRSQVVGISEASAVAFLLTTSCVMVAAAGLFVSHTRSALSAAERQIQIHAWHLQQLVPSARTDPAASVS